LPFSLLVGDLEICLLKVTTLSIHLLLLGIKDLLKLSWGALHGRSFGHGFISLCFKSGQFRGKRLDLLVFTLTLRAPGFVELRDELLDPCLKVLVLLLELSDLGCKVTILLSDNLAFPFNWFESGEAFSLIIHRILHLIQLSLILSLCLSLGGLKLLSMFLDKLLQLILMPLGQLVLLGLQIDGMHGFQVFDVTRELSDVTLVLLQDFILVG